MHKINTEISRKTASVLSMGFLPDAQDRAWGMVVNFHKRDGRRVGRGEPSSVAFKIPADLKDLLITNLSAKDFAFSTQSRGKPCIAVFPSLFLVCKFTPFLIKITKQCTIFGCAFLLG